MVEVEQAPVSNEPIAHDFIKLIKNSRGYNWEIRLLALDIERLEFLNNEMLKRWGKDESN